MTASGVRQYAEGCFLFDSFKKHNCIAAFSARRIDLGFQHNPNISPVRNYRATRKEKEVSNGVKKNRALFLRRLKINPNDLVCLRQAHGNRIYFAAKEDKGRGALTYASAIPGYDAMVTKARRLPLAVFTADCLSIFLLDTKTGLAAVAHSGWRGTKDAIALNLLAMLKDKFSSQPEHILCGFGPSIRSCCYEVGPEFADYFSHGLIRRRGKFFLDLVEANLRQLLSAGILKKNITTSSICTSCQHKDFFSYRREGPSAGRMMSVIMMK